MRLHDRLDGRGRRAVDPDRRAKEGGSYRVTVTLTQTAAWILGLGLNDKAQLEHIADLGPEHQIQKPNVITRTTPCGEFTRLGSHPRRAVQSAPDAAPQLEAPPVG